MSAVAFWIIAITSYLFGACFGAATRVADDEDLTAVCGLTIVLGFITLLVLIGVKIGGAA